jgi:hypothetical protein
MALVSCQERDFLDQDPELRGQKYVCLSFLSPEDVIRSKDVFVFGKFMDSISKDVTMLLDSISAKFKDYSDVQDLVHSVRERHGYLNDNAELQAQFDAFKSENPGLDDEYSSAHDFQTCVRGIKVRGTYDTMLEAENRVKKISQFDNKFNVYVAQVGCWCPWSPHPDAVQDSVYAETQLNTLMKGYHENVAKKDELHVLRKKAFLEYAKQTTEQQKSLVIKEEPTDLDLVVDETANGLTLSIQENDASASVNEANAGDSVAI